MSRTTTPLASKATAHALALLLALGTLGVWAGRVAPEPAVLDVKQFGASGNDVGTPGFGRMGAGGMAILDVVDGESFRVGEGIHLWHDEEPLTLAAVDVGQPDVVAEVSETWGNGHFHCVGGLAFRIRDAKNYWVARRFSLQANGVFFHLARVENGIYQRIGGGVRQDTGLSIRVETKGPSIRVFTDGKLLVETNDPFCERETKVGLHHGGPEGVNDGDRNFRSWYEGAGQPVFTGFRVTDGAGKVLAQDDFPGQTRFEPLKATQTGQPWQMLAGEFVSSATARAICNTRNTGMGLSAMVTAVIGNTIKIDRPWPGHAGDAVQLRHDDTAAFQRALAVVRPPAILALPDGVYALSQPLVIPKGVALIAVPARSTFVTLMGLPGLAPGPEERYLVDITSDEPAWQALERVDIQGLRMDTNPGLSGIRIRGKGGRYDFSNILFRRRGVVVEGGGNHVIRSLQCASGNGSAFGPAYSVLGGSVLPVFDNLKVGFLGVKVGFWVDAPDGGVDLRALNSEQPLRPLVAMRYKELIAAGCVVGSYEAGSRFAEQHPAVELKGKGMAFVDGMQALFPVGVSLDGKSVSPGVRKEDIGTPAEWRGYRFVRGESRLVRDSFAWGETGAWPRFQAWMAPYLPSVKDFGASGSAARTAGKANGATLTVTNAVDFQIGQGIYLWDTVTSQGLATVLAKLDGPTFTLAAAWPGVANASVEVYHDDWPAIRAAQRALFGINKIPRTGRTDTNTDDFMRGRLLFPPGTYNISQTLEATSYAGLVGLPGPEGVSPRIVALPGFAPQAKDEQWIVHFVNGHARLDACANDNFFEQCEGLELDALRPETNPGLSGMFLAASIGSRFSHLAIRGFRKRGLVLSYGCDNVSFRDIEIDPAHALSVEGPALTMGGQNTNTLMFERVRIRNLFAGIGVEVPATFGGVEFRSLRLHNVGRPVVGTHCGALNLYGLIVSADPGKGSGPAVELTGHSNVFVDGITDSYGDAVRGEAPGQKALTLAGSRQPGQWRRFRWCFGHPGLTIEDGDLTAGARAQVVNGEQ